VEELAEINESGKLSSPTGVSPSQKELYDAALRKRENDLFQTGRLYVHIFQTDRSLTFLTIPLELPVDST